MVVYSKKKHLDKAEDMIPFYWRNNLSSTSIRNSSQIHSFLESAQHCPVFIAAWTSECCMRAQLPEHVKKYIAHHYMQQAKQQRGGVKETVWRPERFKIWSLQAEFLFMALSDLYIKETTVRALNSNFNLEK